MAVAVAALHCRTCPVVVGADMDKTLQRAFSRVSFLLYSVPVEEDSPHVAESYMSQVLAHDFDDVLDAILKEPDDRISGWLHLLRRAMSNDETTPHQCIKAVRRGIRSEDLDVRYAAVLLAMACESCEGDDLLRRHLESGTEDEDFISHAIEEHLLYRDNCL